MITFSLLREQNRPSLLRSLNLWFKKRLMGRLTLHIFRAQDKNGNERSWPPIIIFPCSSSNITHGCSEGSASRLRAIEAGIIWAQLFRMRSRRDIGVRAAWSHKFLTLKAGMQLWARGSFSEIIKENFRVLWEITEKYKLLNVNVGQCVWEGPPRKWLLLEN